MPYRLFTGLGILFLLSLSFPKPSHAKLEASIDESDQLDLELLESWIGDSRIVSLGESSHGIGEFFSLKSSIVKHLHRHLNFEIVAIEGGFGDLNLTWLQHQQLTAKQLRDQSLFGNFRNKEINPLFDYIKLESKEKSPLLLSGFDPQSSSSQFENMLKSIGEIRQWAMDVDQELSHYTIMFQATFKQDSSEFHQSKLRYLSALRKMRKDIKSHQEEIKQELGYSDEQLLIILKTLDMKFHASNYSFAERMNEEWIPRGIQLRDSIMAENVQWLIDSLYPGKKIILWGHNGHLQSGPMNSLRTKWMGQYLKERFSEQYFSLGLFAYQGSVYQHWTGQSVHFKNDSVDMIEHCLTKGVRPIGLQHLKSKNAPQWVNQELRAFEPENNGYVRFVPADRFDAALCILNASPPQFD